MATLLDESHRLDLSKGCEGGGGGGAQGDGPEGGGCEGKGGGGGGTPAGGERVTGGGGTEGGGGTVAGGKAFRSVERIQRLVGFLGRPLFDFLPATPLSSRLALPPRFRLIDVILSSLPPPPRLLFSESCATLRLDPSSALLSSRMLADSSPTPMWKRRAWRRSVAPFTVPSRRFEFEVEHEAAEHPKWKGFEAARAVEWAGGGGPLRRSPAIDESHR